jgi:hypothetical protein
VNVETSRICLYISMMALTVARATNPSNIYWSEATNFFMNILSPLIVRSTMRPSPTFGIKKMYSHQQKLFGATGIADSHSARVPAFASGPSLEVIQVWRTST